MFCCIEHKVPLFCAEFALVFGIYFPLGNSMENGSFCVLVKTRAIQWTEIFRNIFILMSCFSGGHHFSENFDRTEWYDVYTVHCCPDILCGIKIIRKCKYLSILKQSEIYFVTDFHKEVRESFYIVLRRPSIQVKMIATPLAKLIKATLAVMLSVSDFQPTLLLVRLKTRKAIIICLRL